MPLATLTPSLVASKPKGVECPVCFSTCKPRKLVGGACNHLVCRACTFAYLKSTIEDGITQVRCPHVGAKGERCDRYYTAEFIRNSLRGHPGIFYRFNYLYNLNDTAVCPNCGLRNARPPSDSGEEFNPAQAKCSDCAFVFCFLHGRAHDATKTCEEYEEALAKQDAASVAVINGTSVKCPKCKAPTTKIDGCNRMQCSRCRVVWCYGCGDWLVESAPYTEKHPYGRPCVINTPYHYLVGLVPQQPPPRPRTWRIVLENIFHFFRAMLLILFTLAVLAFCAYAVWVYLKPILQFAFIAFLLIFGLTMVCGLVKCGVNELARRWDASTCRTRRALQTTTHTRGASGGVQGAGAGDYRLHRRHFHRNAKPSVDRTRAPHKSKGRQ